MTPRQPIKPSLTERFKRRWNGKNYAPPSKEEIEEAERIERKARKSEVEDSEADGLFIDAGDIMFPPEEE